MRVSEYKELLTDEAAECSLLVDYLNELVMQKKIQCYSHIANETYTPSWNAKRKNKKLGVHPGVPDYVIVGNFDLLFIEMKRKKGGTTSAAQQAWISALEAVGVCAKVCRGFAQAKAVIDDWLLL